MTVDARRRIELEAKLDGIRAEFDGWTELTAERGALRLHHSQLRAVVASLAPVVEQLRADIAGSRGDGGWTRTERTLLRLHELWHFFREKLLQRMAPGLGGYLALADDYAWECYQPALTAAAGQAPAREPPLTFLGPYGAPFAVPRGASYADEVWPSWAPAGVMRAAARRMPVPVVGLPWFQVRYLPDALIVGHEVGHHVETDFRLLPDIRQRLGAAGRSTAWPGWGREVFADIYGTLCGGLAFGHALADFAGTGDVAVAGNREYPPAGLRIALVSETLRAQGLTTDADALAARATGDPGPARDVPRVVEALVGEGYAGLGGASLIQVQSFAGQRDAARYAADALLQGAGPQVGQTRTLLAAAGLAFQRDPGRYRGNGLTDRVIAAASARRAEGVRSASEADRRAGRYTATGADIAALLHGDD